jgi:hypothetical protein
MKEKTVCDFDCLNCSLPDCQRNTRDVARQAVTRRKKREQIQRDSWNYAYMAEVPEPDYTTGLITRTMDKAELEAMLAAQYGDKLEPVKKAKK